MTIGVIGCGNMGSALIRGMVESRAVPASRIVAWDSDSKRLLAIARKLKIGMARSNREVAGCSVIVLAVKPQQMGQVLAEIRPHLGHRPLLFSIAAGIPTGWIERRAGRGVPVVRVMPNTPALVGKGISALSLGRSAGPRHRKVAERIVGSVGEVIPLEERWMDAVTALSGSGPAYFFFLMEQMMEAGVRLGLKPAVARRLVLATAQGAAELALQSDEEPGVLRARVTSKGGTTEAVFKVFARGKLGQVIQAGIRAAARRAKELKS